MTYIENQSFDQERALYNSRGIHLNRCSFDGPADGESAFKESFDIITENCFFNLRYPFWHCRGLKISGCELTVLCRAALWYSDNVKITDTKMHGIKALRECSNVSITGGDIVSPEFGWYNKDVKMTDSTAESEYFMMRCERLDFTNVRLKGKYSFQYVTDSVFENCNFDTKDAFWHVKNVTVRNSTIKGEYLGWYCENVTFENCTILGTQPLCYCKNLTLINCKMYDADLCFEKSTVNAEVTTPVISIKNPTSGKITVPSCDTIIKDSEQAQAEIIITG